MTTVPLDERRSAVAQSYWTLSGQVTWYQNEREPLEVGTVNVWLTDESPAVAVSLPS